MFQVQCPNCGGYRVNLEETVSIPTGTVLKEPVPTFKLVGSIIFCVVLFVGCGIVVVIAASNFFSAKSSFEVSGLGSAILCGGFMSILGLWAGIAYFKELRDARKAGFVQELERTEVYHYYCLLCGYRWTEPPKPQITVRPDLIAAGNQRLEQEAAKRKTDEEAWWWYEQQKKKKK